MQVNGDLTNLCRPWNYRVGRLAFCFLGSPDQAGSAIYRSYISRVLEHCLRRANAHDDFYYDRRWAYRLFHALSANDAFPTKLFTTACERYLLQH